jgi:ABC-type sugar transport system substrate-binding protein
MVCGNVQRGIGASLAVALAVGSLPWGGCGKKADDTTDDRGATTRGTDLSVGFSQEGAESGWRAANTLSIRQAAADAGVELHFTDSLGDTQKQLAALDVFLQQRLDVVAFSPKEATGWEPTLRKLKAAHIPVIVSDRDVTVSDPSLQPVFIGSDLKEEGRRAGAWLARKTAGHCDIVELEGNIGASVTTDRTNGFREAIAGQPNMRIIASRNADFSRAKGKEVMEAILKSPEGHGVTAVYAENDDMALGAVQALEEAGKKPGTEVVIVCIDAVRDGLQAIIDGKVNCAIECTPLLGPAIMDAARKLKAGEPVPARIISDEALFDDPAQVRAVIGSRKY